MHRFLEYSKNILDSYQGQQPFHLYLRKYFSTHKKHGSRDRKIISRFCYAYLRLGQGVISEPGPEERMLLGIFLTEDSPTPLLDQKPEWNERIAIPQEEKIKYAASYFDIDELFPFGEKLSSQISLADYSLSFLQQPKTFLRIRPGKRKIVLNKLTSVNLTYETIGEDALAFSNPKNIEEVLHLNKEVVIQDLSSQQTVDIVIPFEEEIHSVWDCCAGSGGKSILLYDKLPSFKLTVSDIRKSILVNLKNRFSHADIQGYQALQEDVVLSTSKEKSDLILADMPCTGSGTWARTPELLRFFDPATIEEFVALQQRLVSNTMKNLAPRGYYLYITCSVFSAENEDQAEWIRHECGLTLIESKYILGYNLQADTLYTALFQKV